MTAPAEVPAFVPGLEALREALLADGYPDGSARLVDLFGRGKSVDEGQAAKALSGVELADLVGAGLLDESDGGRIRARVRIDVRDGLVLASDLDSATGPGRVAGLARVSRALAALTVRRDHAASLDLGTGMGIHALLAARHSRRVLATDVNPRAVAFAEFNAALNGVDNVSLVVANWFEGLPEERFDQITASPTGRPTLESVKAFHESGLADDSDARELVRGATEWLAEDGFAYVFANRLHEGPDGWYPFEDLLEGAPCDALLLVYDARRPVEFVELQHGVLARQDPSDRIPLRQRWGAYYERSGITRSAWGVFVLRRREGPGWRRTVEAWGRPAPGDAARVVEIFGD